MWKSKWAELGSPMGLRPRNPAHKRFIVKGRVRVNKSARIVRLCISLRE